jgi:hypothetical protein
MNGVEVTKAALQSSHGLTTALLKDLSDADLLVRPVPGANHIAWQFGHFIAGEVHMVRELAPSARLPELPAGFAEQHNKESAGKDTGFLTRAQYIELFDRVRQATIAYAGGLSDADLDRPNTGSMAQFAPTVGAKLLLIANHPVMHIGQFSVVRRKLGKPILF